jgi:uncharacterized membrane protein
MGVNVCHIQIIYLDFENRRKTMRNLCSSVTLVLTLVLAASPMGGTAGVRDDFSTMGAAVNAANPGYIGAPGTYFEHIVAATDLWLPALVAAGAERAVLPLTAQAVPDIFIAIDFPGASLTTATGINNRGEIVGQADGHGFVHGKIGTDRFRVIEFPGAFFTVATGINDRGHIVGYYSIGAPNQGFVYDGINFVSIDFPGALETTASGINNRGHIVGSYQDASLVFHGFLYDGVNFFTIDFPGAVSTRVEGINDRGDIVGTGIPTLDRAVGFLYDGVNFRSINFPGAFRTRALGINNRGEIVGAYNTDPIPRPGDAFHGFLFDGVNFSSIDFPGAFSTNTFGINERGEIVGEYRTASGPTHGFFATSH